MDPRHLLFQARKRATTASLWTQGYARALAPVGKPPLRNVYFATVQRSGSQWLRAVFNDPRIIASTGLRVYPQHRYEWDEFHGRFPPFTFVPGLYMSYDLYEEIQKPGRYRTFFVLRDPRSIVVSWYWAALESHSLMGKIGRYRRDLRELDFSDGLAYSIRALTTKFADMRTWMDHADDPHVLIVHFEELTQAPDNCLAKILTHCEARVDRETIGAVLEDYTKAKMRQRDLERNPTAAESHYRSRSSNYREAFEPRHYDLFAAVTGDLVELTGYAETDA